MSVIEKLASSIGRRDEIPNQELAEQLFQSRDKKAIAEVVSHLAAKNKNIQSDCIKVLYELGEKDPSLISAYTEQFLSVLDSKNNRLAWGAMTAIDMITAEDPERIYSQLPRILTAADNGSVISRDHAVGILVKLSAIKKYTPEANTALLKIISAAPHNQLPTYAEKALPVISGKNKEEFFSILIKRIGSVEKETTRKRLEKLIKLLSRT